MTTVIWDGSVLIADSQATDEDGNKSFGAVKIKALKMTTYKGEKVEAMGLSGDYRTRRVFSDYIQKDVTDSDFFREAIIFKHDSSVILVTTCKVVYIDIKNSVVKFTEYPRSTALCIGSGKSYVGKMVSKVDAYLLLALAVIVDDHSGGTMTTWCGGEVTTGTTLPKHFLASRLIWSSVKTAIKNIEKDLK